MKTAVITSIKAYQIFISPFLKQVLGTKQFCRYTPTCSEYAIVVVKRHGIIQGLRMAFKRFLSCQPLGDIFHGKHI